MSLATALKTGDLAQLPSRRDEDWRWSDLRGLLRDIPPASPSGDATVIGPGAFAGLADSEVVILNGRPLTTSSIDISSGPIE